MDQRDKGGRRRKVKGVRRNLWKQDTREAQKKESGEIRGKRADREEPGWEEDGR
jgi:hypothetical protein